MSKRLSAAALTERLNQAVTLLNSGALDAAANAFQSILRDAPKDPNALHLLGRTYSLQGRPLEAIPLIEAAVQAMPNFANVLFSLAVAYQQSGQAAKAIPILADAVQRQPGQADWHLTLAELYLDQERAADAVPHYRAALAAGRQEAPIWNNLGMALKAVDDFDGAEQAYQQALGLSPNFPQALNNLGSLWRTRGREDQAFRCFQRAITLAPNFGDPHFNQALILVARKQMDDADATFQRACTLAPHRLDWQEKYAAFLMSRKQLNQAEPILASLAQLRDTPKEWLNLANIQLAIGKESEAREIILRWYPIVDIQTCSVSIENLQAHVSSNNPSFDLINFFSKIESDNPNIILSRAYLHLSLFRRDRDANHIEQATALSRQLLRTLPNSAHGLTTLGLCYMESGRLEQALEAFRAAIEQDENLFITNATYGYMLYKSKNHSKALKYLKKAHELSPEDSNNNNNYGICLSEIGHIDEGLKFMKKSACEGSQTGAFFSNMLFMMHFSSNIDRNTILEASKQFNIEVAASLAPDVPPTCQGTADKKLRIGFVSNDFRQHVVNMFFESTLENLRSYDAEFHLFSNVQSPDNSSKRLMNIANYWHDIYGMTDDSAADYINKREIDILVDLSGHTAGNRLLIFARRPAPVQISWLGYFATTGLAAMDYIFGDPICTPPSLEPWFTETVYRLPDGFVCYTPQQTAPPIAPLPALTQGYVTFVSANQLAKITDPTVELWCDLLRLVPNSRLALRTMVFTDGDIVAQTKARFTNRGIEVDRLDFTTGGNSAGILNFYNNQADIALDPLPCVGGTTTCEALWMGVPVVTLLGDRFAARHSASHLTNVGVPELIATTPEQYLDIAAGLANDLPRLADLRARLRPMMAASPLCDAPRFAANLMQAFRACWQDALNRRQQA